MASPTVSAVIPTCNRPDLLPIAIRSVLNQTFRDLEIIVVDDASDEPIDAVIRALDDPRIRWIRHDRRRGGAAARNTGIRNSNGEFLAFLDDDDEWYPEKLARQTDRMRAGPSNVACVYTGYATVDRSTGVVQGERIPEKKGDLSKELLISNCIGGTSSILVSRECLSRVGLFDESLPSFQDYDLYIRISQCYHFDCVREVLLKYYVHQEKIWTNLDAVADGIRRMLIKHGASRSFRRYLSYQYLSLGVNYCHRGEAPKAKHAYLQAIKLYPLEIRHYFNLGLSVLGPETFARIKHAKDNTRAHLT